MKIIINTTLMVPIYEQIVDQIKLLIRTGELKENDNLLGVYDRKSRDHEFIDSITESIKERTLQDENDRVNAISVENTDFVSPVPPETDGEIIKEEIVEVSDEKTETEEDISVSVKTTEQAEIKDDDNLSSAAEKSDDSGDFSI